MTTCERAQQLIDDLEAAEAEIQDSARTTPPGQFHTRPVADEWSVGEILAHMADSPLFYTGEVRRLVRAEGGTFGRSLDDPERLSPVNRQANDSLEQALAANRAGVAGVRELLEELTDRDLEWRARHPRQGDFAIDGLIERFIIGHRRTHAQQIRETVAALGRGHPS